MQTKQKGNNMSMVRRTLKDLQPLTAEDMTRLRKLAEMSDESIDYSDIPPLPDDFFANAQRFHELYRPQKRQVTVRIDADVLDWLKSGGKGYQTRLNEILRQVMLQQAKN